MRIKIKKHNLYTNCVFFLWMVYCFSFYFLKQSEFAVMYEVSDAFRYISFGVSAALYLLFFATSRLRLRELPVYFFIGLVVISSVFIIRDAYMTVFLGFIFTARRIDIMLFVRFDIKIKAAVVLIIVSLCLLGLIPSYSANINGQFKQAFGFTHPNTFAEIVMVILFEWIYIRFGRMKLWDYLYVIAAAIVMWNITASRTFILPMFFILAFILLLRHFPKIVQNPFVKYTVALLPALCTGLSYWLMFLFEKGNSVAVKINEITTHRILQACRLYGRYGFSLFGQQINTRGTRTVSYPADALFNVDMSYVYLPVKYGVFFLLILLVGYFFFTKKAAEKGDPALFAAVLYFALAGFAEGCFYRIEYNFTLLFILAFVGERFLPPKRRRRIRFKGVT